MLLKELLYSHLIFSCKLTMNNYYGYTCNITPKMFLGTSTIYLKGSSDWHLDFLNKRKYVHVPLNFHTYFTS